MNLLRSCKIQPLPFLTNMAGREAIIQEFHNSEGFQSLQLHNVQPTGTFLPSGCGTYGKVEKVKVGHSIRAGKIFDEAIYKKTFQQVSKMRIVNHYIDECKRIVGIDHPNIEKVIGMFMHPNHIFPVLVMELLDNNLHQYLEINRDVPLVLKQTILEDVAKGLLYLHTQSPKIIHRNLTAWNVLLTSSLVAKVTDIGNTNLAELALQNGGAVMWSHKVRVYMPPEFEDETKRGLASYDVFSFGHLILFTVIQVFPDQLLPSDYCHPENPEWIVGRSESDRRREYFKQMDLKLPQGTKHPLVGLSQECLRNDPAQRPSTSDMLARLRQLVKEVGRIPEEGETMDRMEVMQLLHQQDSLHTMMPQEKEEYYSRIEALEGENEALKMKLHKQQTKASKELEDKDNIISEKNIQLLEMEQQVEKLQAEQTMAMLRFKEALTNISQKQECHKQLASDMREKVVAVRAEEDTLRSQLDGELSQLVKNALSTLDPVTMLSPKKSSVLDLTWEQLPDLPVSLPKYPCAAFLDGTLYVGGATTKDHAHTIFTFRLDHEEAWGKLPPCPRREFGMGVVNNALVIVGGVDVSNKKSGKVTVWDVTGQQWREGLYPSLLSARTNPSVVTYENWVIVIGGAGGLVEKLDLELNKPWTACPPVPDKCSDLSCVAVEHTLYVAGSYTNLNSSSSDVKNSGRSLYNVLLPLLVRIKPKDPTVWNKMAVTVPTQSSTLFAISQRSILAVGGEVDVASSLALLSPVLSLTLRRGASSKWERVGSLPCERICCTCLGVGENGRSRIVILGGTQTQAQEGLKRVDMGVLKGQR